MADGVRWNVQETMGLTMMEDDINEALVIDRAERSVLSSALIRADIAAVLPTLLRAEDFASAAHGQIYEAINALVASRVIIDEKTLGAELKRRGRLTTVGGLAYLIELVEEHVTAINVEAHARIVREAGRARRTGVAAASVVELVKRGAPMADIDRAAVAVPGSAASDEEVGFTSMAEAIDEVLSNIVRLADDPTGAVGVTTGLIALDRLTGRLRPGQLVVIGGRPAMGKTSLAQAIAEAAQAEECTAAQRDGRVPHPVLFVSLEMPRAELASRDLSRGSGVDLARIISGRMNQDEINRTFAEARRRFASPVKTLHGSPKLSKIRAHCHREKARAGGVVLVVVDYIQLVPAEQRSDSREREVSEVSRGLKLLAGELGCPVIALSQLNRDLERRGDKRPTLADLRESGAVEQDADLVMFVYRDEVYNKGSADHGIAELIVAKQRNGPTDTVRVRFDRARTAFVDCDGDAEDEPSPRYAGPAIAYTPDDGDGLPGAIAPAAQPALDLGPQYAEGA